MSAVPTYTTMAAAPVQYVQQPMVEYAQPQYEYVQQAPAVEYIQQAPQYIQQAPVEYIQQAPQYIQQAPVEYIQQAAPQYVTTQTPSYVQAPMSYAMPQMIQTPAAPMAPPKLTEGIPTPDQISKQKAGYSAALDKQLKEAIETVQKETQIEKEMIAFTAEKNIALYNMQVDERAVEAVALVEEQSTFALLELNKAKVERGLQLNNQANGLVMDYQMKAVQTELAQKQYAFQQEYMKAENDLAVQFNAQVAQANTGTTYSAPAATVV